MLDGLVWVPGLDVLQVGRLVVQRLAGQPKFHERLRHIIALLTVTTICKAPE